MGFSPTGSLIPDRTARRPDVSGPTVGSVRIQDSCAAVVGLRHEQRALEGHIAACCAGVGVISASACPNVALTA